MFIDWLTVYQDFTDRELPYLSDTREIVIDTHTNEVLAERSPVYKYEGSYSTTLSIFISKNRIRVKGNPSRINRIDNLWGFTSLDDCVRVYNHILLSLGLPPFTKCTKTYQLTGEDGKKAPVSSDGAIIQELHITSNKAVGLDNPHYYLRALSTQRYRNSIPRLHANGSTLDWLSKRGHAPLIYASVYSKGDEIALHQLPKIKRIYGENSPEYKSLYRVYMYTIENGVVRFEQKLKSRFLIRENLRFWGLSDFSKLESLHQEFLSIDSRLGVNTMTYQTIAELLKEENIVKSVQAANATASYYFMWLHGKKFDLTNRNVQRHRARLRRLNIDIAEPCDTSKNFAVRIKDVKEIEIRELSAPDWYEMPTVKHLKLVA